MLGKRTNIFKASFCRKDTSVATKIAASPQPRRMTEGSIAKSLLLFAVPLILGNLLQQELPDILNSPRARAMHEGFSRRTPSEDLCRRCGYAARFSK